MCCGVQRSCLLLTGDSCMLHCIASNESSHDLAQEDLLYCTVAVSGCQVCAVVARLVCLLVLLAGCIQINARPGAAVVLCCKAMLGLTFGVGTSQCSQCMQDCVKAAAADGRCDHRHAVTC
jgi:hypothetical protein